MGQFSMEISCAAGSVLNCNQQISSVELDDGTELVTGDTN
jgi:hypothetical protein